MIFSNEKLKKMHQKFLKYNYKYSMYYKRMSEDSRFKHRSHVLINRSENIKNCCNFWEWHLYEKNKKMDLQKVSICNVNGCPNCRAWRLSKQIVNFKMGHAEMIERGYNPYLMTLTIPNCIGSELGQTIERLRDTFRRFLQLFEQKRKGKSYKNRLFDIKAAVSVVEITVKKSDKNSYHPHLHLIVYLENDFQDDFEKFMLGAYQKKSKSNIYFSQADLQIMILWYMAWNNIPFFRKNYDDVANMFEDYYTQWQQKIFTYPEHTWCGIYMCDIRPLCDEKGVYEVFKYTYKDTHIFNYENFSTIYEATYRKVLKQTHGELYHLKLDKEVGEKQALEEYLSIQEIPRTVYTKYFDQLYTTYHDYEKISRFKAREEIENVMYYND